MVLVLLTALLVRQIPTEHLMQQYEDNFAEVVLLQKAGQEPDRAIWQRLIGDLMLTRKMDERALRAYEKAYSIEPVNPDILNNLAWLLLTSEDLTIRDPLKALNLARAAVALQPRGYILDTLATAYWANGLIDEAVEAEKQAIIVDRGQQRFYQAQIQKFLNEPYLEVERETVE